MSARTLWLDEVEAIACRALAAAGASPVAAASVARSTRLAERDGIRSHGLLYVPIYAEHLRCGKVDGQAVPQVEQPRPGTVRVDAAHGFAHAGIDAGWPVFTHAPASIAPPAGYVPVIGTNPFALAGSMLPSGGYKGFGIGLLVEIFAAALAGANLSCEASPFSGAAGGPPGTGQCSLAFDPEGFSGAGFGERMQRLAEYITSQDGARLPGSRRAANRTRTEAEGVEVDEALLLRIIGRHQKF